VNHKTAKRADSTWTFLGGRSDLEDNPVPGFEPAAVYPGKDRVGFMLVKMLPPEEDMPGAKSATIQNSVQG
jgi:hypothetical protein